MSKTRFCISARCGIAAAIALTMINGAYVSAAPAKQKTGQFDQVQTFVSPRLSLKTTDHVIFKGVRYRLESADPASYQPYDDIEDGQSYYHYLPSAHTALRLKLPEKQISPLDSLKLQTESKLQGATKTGETTVNGFDCDTYVRDMGDGTKVTLYQSKDPKFPYIVKTSIAIPSAGVTRSNSIENVKLDVPVDDGTFTLPAGTKIVDAPANNGASGTGAAPAAASGS